MIRYRLRFEKIMCWSTTHSAGENGLTPVKDIGPRLILSIVNPKSWEWSFKLMIDTIMIKNHLIQEPLSACWSMPLFFYHGFAIGEMCSLYFRKFASEFTSSGGPRCRVTYWYAAAQASRSSLIIEYLTSSFIVTNFVYVVLSSLAFSSVYYEEGMKRFFTYSVNFM